MRSQHSDHRPLRVRSPIAIGLNAIALALVMVTPGLSQLVSEDIAIEEQLVSPEIEQIFEKAQGLFQSVDQADSVPLFSRVIEELEPMVLTGDERVLALLRSSLLQRSEANHNFGQTDVARSDLITLVTTSPTYDVDRGQVSDQIAKMFDQVKADLVGFVEFLIDPPDASVSINGNSISTDTGPVAVLAGSYSANIQRPGFTSSTSTFDVAPDQAQMVEAVLERTSAVLFIRTRPSDARVFVDGVERALTSGVAGDDFIASGDAAAYDRSEFSELTWIDNLDAGGRRVEVRKAGFRTFETSVEIDGLTDVHLGAVPLEKEAGTLVLSALPSDAQVALDGKPVRPFAGASPGSAELPLAPGSYVISVTRGVFGRFETTIDIADRRATAVTVRLQPALVMLGVLGKDEVGKRRLRSGLADAFQAEGQWAMLDRADAAGNLFGDLGINAGKLRKLVSGTEQGTIDWARVQSTLDEQMPGSVYLLGVLSDDLLANEASLWIWPAAPGPSKPELRRVRLDQPDEMKLLAAAFQPKLDPVRPTLGATLIDTPLAGGPVIVEVVADKAAHKAGLQLGDAITSLGGVPVYSEALFSIEFLKLEAGETVTLEIERDGQLMEAELVTGRSFTIIDLSDPRRVAAALAAALAGEMQSASRWPKWVLQLNQAAILLNAGEAEAAVRALRQIDASQTPGTTANGLSMGTVSYWLGVALEQAGPRYIDRATDAYRRAAASEGARFLHDDGPRVAPRAWSRLQRLAPTNP